MLLKGCNRFLNGFCPDDDRRTVSHGKGVHIFDADYEAIESTVGKIFWGDDRFRLWHNGTTARDEPHTV